MKNKANINTDSEDFSIEMNRGHTALVIDGDVVSGQAICEMLSMRGYESVACDSIRSAKEVLSSQSLIILSLHQEIDKYFRRKLFRVYLPFAFIGIGLLVIGLLV